MFKNKRYLLIVSLLLLVGFVAVVAANNEDSDYTLMGFDYISPYVDSNRYSHQKSDDIVNKIQDINPDYETIETDMGTVYLDNTSLAFQVYNNNEYLWSSTIDYKNEEFPSSIEYSMRSALNISSYNTKNVNYTVVREHLFTPGTTIDLSYIVNGFKASIEFGTSKTALNLYVTFSENKIEVKIPNDEIIESDKYKLKNIQVYKDFGSVKNDEIPGYVFIPDGVGALIDYKKEELGIPNYKKSIYGNPIGYNTEDNLNDLVQDGSRIYAPVFGFVHGVDQQAVFANITSGDIYGNINVYYPSRNRGYMTVFPEFIYRSTYNQPVDQLGNTITLLQEHRNNVDISIQYNMLENNNANYVGMGLKYRDYLQSIGATNQENTNNVDIPIQLSFLASENKQGVLWKKNIQLTTLSDIYKIINNLNQELSDSIVISIDGFTNDGASWSGPEYKGLSRSFGSKDELEKVFEIVDELYLITNHMMASSTNGGYNKYTDLAKKINDQIYTYQFLTSKMYLLEHDFVYDATLESVKEMNGLNYNGLALSHMGSILYEDFSNKNYIDDQIETLTSLLLELDKNIALYDSNAYFFPYIDAYFDFPLYSSQFISFDDTVPFLPIALSNLMDLYSPYANFFPYVKDDLLRMVDFHVYPSFIITEESSKYLQKTNLESIYASQCDLIEPALYVYYDFVNEALKSTKDASITYREILDEGVVKVTYSNEVWIIINYNDESININEQIVDAKSYLVGGTS